jgi:sugar phosphate permease
MDAAMNTTERLSSLRWMVLAIIVAVQFQIMLVTFAPAAVASPIISDLQLTRTEFGLIMSALNIAIMICQVLGSVLVDRAGLKLALLTGVALLGIGAAFLLSAYSLEFVLFARVLQGIGIGICFPVMGALIVAWFSKREQPYINTIFAAVTFLGIGSGMIVTVGLFGWLNRSWRQAIGTYGFSILATALIWLVIGRNRQGVVSVGETSAGGATIKNPNSLPKALTMPVVWTLGLATFAVSWVYNMDLSFIPLFLESGHGISLADANRLASLLPFSGIAGVIVFGVLASPARWRKHLLSTSCAVVLLGSIALFFGEGITIKAGLLFVGFGLSGWLPVLNTYIMGLPSMTPSLMAAFVVLVNMAIYLAGFISPLAVGWLSQSSFGLRNSLALFSWFELVAILIFMRLPTSARVDVQAAREQAHLAVAEIPRS